MITPLEATIGGLRMKYRKKPVVIEAIQYHGDINPVKDFVDFEKLLYSYDTGEHLIRTLEGDHRISVGDYIIKGVKGEFYPCKPDIFEMTYEKVE